MKTRFAMTSPDSPYRPESQVDILQANYEKNLNLLGVFHYIAGGLISLSSCLFVVHIAIGIALRSGPELLGRGFAAMPPWAGTIFMALGATAVAIGWTMAALIFAAGRCIRQRKAPGFCLVVAGLSCVWFPFGTILGVITLVQLTKPHVRVMFDRADAPKDHAPPRVRPWVLALAAVVTMVALAVFVGSSITGALKGNLALHRPSAPREAREERSRAAFRVAPGPVPLALPLRGAPGVDADGYPTQYVDRSALRSLLYARKLRALDDYVGQFQASFEADPLKEYWPIDAGEAFASAEPELETELNVWVAASPDSFAARYARGSHYVAVMWAMRGTKYRSETPDDDFRAMTEAGRKAIIDLDEALRLRPRLVAAMRQEMRVAMATSDHIRHDEMRDRALRACPGCIQPRATNLRALTPRWGGSYAAMRSFVATSPAAASPRLAVLSGYEYLDRAELLGLDKKHDQALAAIELAVKSGDYWEYMVERADILRRMDRFDEALSSLNRADAQRPMHPPILAMRADVRRRREQFVAAGHDLLDALRIEPANEDAKDALSHVLSGVLWKAQRLEFDRDHAGALEAAELGIDLGPLDRQAHGIHTQIVLGDATTPERIAALQTYVAAHPGEFHAVQQLDYALSRQNRYPEILVLWDAYLALHPDDGRGYLERSGTNHHLGKSGNARADAARACELGNSEGCEWAAR
jgi:tetratricopeptide (TPR) repeat protein